jgi:hypothetical protein
MNILKNDILICFAKRNRTLLCWQFSEYDESYVDFCKLIDDGYITIQPNERYNTFIDVKLTEEGKRIADLIAL